MRSQPDAAGSDASRNAWSSTVVSDSLLLTARTSQVADGVWCG